MHIYVNGAQVANLRADKHRPASASPLRSRQRGWPEWFAGRIDESA